MKANKLLHRFIQICLAAFLAGTAVPVAAAGPGPDELPPATDAIGLVTSANYQADNLTLDDQYLYPTFSSISVVDLNPESLKLFYKFRTDYIFDLLVKGQYAFAGQQDKGLRVFDISVATPTMFSSHAISGGAYGLALSGTNLLITTGQNGLQIRDTTKPYDMPVVSQLALDGFAKQVSASGNLALIAAGKAGVHIVDISKPEAPTLISTYKTDSPAENATLNGSTGYLALGTGGMLVLDLKDPSKPIILSSLESRDFVRRVIIKDDFAYLAERDAGIRIVNITDPANPIALAVYNTTGGAWDIAVKDNNIYVADYPYGLLVLRYNPPVNQPIPQSGGTITSVADGISATISADTFSGEIDYRHEPLPAINTPIGPEPALVKTGPFFRNSVWSDGEEASPSSSYTISVKATTTGLTDRQISALSLYYWDTDLKRWRKDVSTRLDKTTGVLTATPDRLGIWGVFYDNNVAYSTLPPTTIPAIQP
ncbi:MAG: hypothetical protein GX577_01390 [Leptolinea sp.]|nr:hypothetical protein [Leptolinea sp.]